jgi:hypothetical protein
MPGTLPPALALGTYLRGNNAARQKPCKWRIPLIPRHRWKRYGSVMALALSLLMAALSQAATHRKVVKPGETVVWKTVHRWPDNTIWTVHVNHGASVFAELAGGYDAWVYSKGVTLRVTQHGRWRFRKRNLAAKRRTIVVHLQKPLAWTPCRC